MLMSTGADSSPMETSPSMAVSQPYGAARNHQPESAGAGVSGVGATGALGSGAPVPACREKPELSATFGRGGGAVAEGSG